MITLHGLTPTQVTICNGLWSAESSDAILALMLAFGKAEVQAMQSLMLAAAFDQVEDTSIASNYLQKFSI